MEQITFIPIETAGGNHFVSFRLSVFYDYNLYETEITSDSFSSEFVELAYFEDLLQEGLKPNITNKLDENLTVKTTFELNSIEDTLYIRLDLKYQKGRLKPRSEKFEFRLKKKEIDNQTTLENVMRGLKKSFNIPQVIPGSSNIYIHIDSTNKKIHYIDPIGKSKKKITMIDGINIKPDFLHYILTKDEKLSKFFSNRLNSQESINQKISEALEKYFDSESIFEFLINFMSRKYCINFIQIYQKGHIIMLNVLQKKQPKESIYYVVNDIEKFNFDESLNYRIVTEFDYHINLVNLVESNESNCLLEISYNANGHTNIYKNGIMDVGIVYKLHDIENNTIYLKSEAYNTHRFYEDAGCTKLTNKNRIRFKSGVGINLSSGVINSNSVYLPCCNYDGSCNCRCFNSYPMAKFPIYHPQQSDFKIKTLYLIEQF